MELFSWAFRGEKLAAEWQVRAFDFGGFFEISLQTGETIRTLYYSILFYALVLP